MSWFLSGRRLAAGAVALCLAMPAHATPDAQGERDIRHLVEFVGNSQCTFIRNGDAHDPKAAAEHLAMKYGKARSRLDSAEDFIERVASRSYLSGREYRVQCPGRPEMAAGVWLRGELAAWRAADLARR